MRVVRRLDDSIRYKVINGEKYKICTECRNYFPMTNEYFYNNKSNKRDGFNTYCIKCTFKRAKKWVENNPEKYEEQKKRKVENRTEEQKERIRNYERKDANYMRNWRSQNRDKLRKYNLKRQMHKDHEISNKEWVSCRKYFNYKCAYCGISEVDAKEEQGQNLHREHVEHDGANDLSNCVPSCKSCNSRKWKYEMLDWYRKQEFFCQEKLNKIIKWLNEDYKHHISN